MAEEIDYTGHRDNRGRFQPGNPGSTGRKPRAHEQAVLDSLRSSFPPERIISILERALKIAEEQNSSRSMIAVAVEVLDRVLGKPVATTPLPQNNAIDEALARLKEQQQEDETQEIARMMSGE